MPPQGRTCSEYLQSFINVVGGYLAEPNATSSCAYCPYRTTDQYLESNFSIKYSHRWRNIGIVIAFIAFNVSSLRCGIQTQRLISCSTDCSNLHLHVHLPHSLRRSPQAVEETYRCSPQSCQAIDTHARLSFNINLYCLSCFRSGRWMCDGLMVLLANVIMLSILSVALDKDVILYLCKELLYLCEAIQILCSSSARGREEE